MAVGVLLVSSGCAGKTTGATNITDFAATLHATARCDTGEVCTWYWEYWPAGTPRLPGRDWPGSEKTPVQGPVTGPTGDQKLSTRITGLTPKTTYRWVFCASPNNGAAYACTGPHGTFGSTTADPPPDSSTFTTAPVRTLAERWNGNRWTVLPTPKLSTNARLLGVSCTSPTACTAVGERETSDGTHVTLAERWDGTSWTIQPTPNPPGGSTSLSGVSCTSATSCIAVGPAVPLGRTTLAEHWDGTSWTIQPTPNPNPTGADSFLNGVSCTSATACMAAGVSIGHAPSGGLTPLTEVWDGASWQVKATPSAGNLRGVSCTSATACTAVGFNAGTLAERWNGTSWAIQPTPNPSGIPELSGVSCASASACTAVGDSANGTGTQLTLAEAWNGASWTIQPTPNPNPNPFGGDKLSGVSCTSAAACTAVGHYQDSAGIRVTLAERWDGSSWAVQPMPSVTSNFFYTTLSGVSCTSATACIAVGAH